MHFQSVCIYFSCCSVSQERFYLPVYVSARRDLLLWWALACITHGAKPTQGFAFRVTLLHPGAFAPGFIRAELFLPRALPPMVCLSLGLRLQGLFPQTLPSLDWKLLRFYHLRLSRPCLWRVETAPERLAYFRETRSTPTLSQVMPYAHALQGL